MARRQIEGSRVAVTGASGGIGRAIALELAAAGAQVLVTARREERLAEVVEQIRASGGEAELVAGDVTDPGTRSRVLQMAHEAWGGLDHLINNAGVGALARFDAADEEQLRRVMEVNFFAVAAFIREALPVLRLGNSPMIAVVGSVLGHRAVPRMSDYCAAKFAVRGLVESIRPELATAGIDLLLVSAGSTESEFYDHMLDQRAEAIWPGRPKVTAEYVARETVRAMRAGRREIIPSRSARWLWRANRWLPGVVDRFLDRYG